MAELGLTNRKGQGPVDPDAPPAKAGQETGPGGILPLELDAVSYEVEGRRLVDGISLRLNPGRRTVLLGHNGAGKSITLRLCHGLLKPTSGEVRWLGPLGRNAREHQAMVFQRPVLLRRSALANITYALGLKGIPAAKRTGLAMEALGRVGLESLARTPARVLSGGEQQRLALARAWALDPEVLFLDEPTASLDPAAARKVEETIQGFHQAGMTIVLTTHDMAEARRLADDVYFIHQGKLWEQSGAAGFFRNPRTREARAFLSGELPL
ncbi:MAG: ATP-binding cassette domain-containing protein [Deltaproteobacteria bacterium]|nr:ATP-binding cassette domain-containing protein [Deltaproteobacteria bacterium]